MITAADAVVMLVFTALDKRTLKSSSNSSKVSPSKLIPIIFDVSPGANTSVCE